MSGGVKFIDPELITVERTDGFRRFEVACVDPTTGSEFILHCLLVEGLNMNDIFAKLGECSVTCVCIRGLDSSISEQKG